MHFPNFNFSKPRVAMGMNICIHVRACMCILTLLSDTHKVFTAVLIFGAGIIHVNYHIHVFYPPL